VAGQRSGGEQPIDLPAGAVLYLCSDAAAQVTGTTISVDGGWTAA
jgi:3-hydroxybutyrate dehydrogenase